MTGTFVVIIYERSFLLSRYQIKFYTSCLWIYVYIINLKVYYILVMHRECAKNLYILVPCFLCICFACQLELVFLVFQVAGESKGNDKYLCFPRHFCSCHSFFFDVVGRGEQLCVRNTFWHTFFSMLIEKIFYAFFRLIICMLDDELGSFLLWLFAMQLKHEL